MRLLANCKLKLIQLHNKIARARRRGNFREAEILHDQVREYITLVRESYKAEDTPATHSQYTEPTVSVSHVETVGYGHGI